MTPRLTNLIFQRLKYNNVNIYMSNYILTKSPLKNKKYRMTMPDENHKHDFGGVRENGEPYRDYILLNDRNSKFYEPDEAERKKVRASYRARHRGDKGLGSKHSPAELSWSLLWSKPTLAKSIKFYENKFNVKVINNV